MLATHLAYPVGSHIIVCRVGTSIGMLRHVSNQVVRISVIVDARFSLIVDGETASSGARRGGAQAPGGNVAQPSTISLKRRVGKGALGPVLGLK